MISTKGYNLEQTNNTDQFTLYIKGSTELREEIYKSINNTRLLTNIFLDDENDTIIFIAEMAVTLTTFLKKGCLTMTQSVKIVYDLSKQIEYLETSGYAFYGYDLDDILVINDTTFIIASSKYLLDIEENNITFNIPINPPYFSTPELNKLTSLPSKINYRSSYYSLGAVVLFCLLNIYVFSELEMNNTEIDQLLEPICYTKMYWFLKRCFNEKSEQRLLLFI